MTEVPANERPKRNADDPGRKDNVRIRDHLHTVRALLPMQMPVHAGRQGRADAKNDSFVTMNRTAHR
jgi:hypothetical protein